MHSRRLAVWMEGARGPSGASFIGDPPPGGSPVRTEAPPPGPASAGRGLRDLRLPRGHEHADRRELIHSWTWLTQTGSHTWGLNLVPEQGGSVGALAGDGYTPHVALPSPALPRAHPSLLSPGRAAPRTPSKFPTELRTPGCRLCPHPCPRPRPEAAPAPMQPTPGSPLPASPVLDGAATGAQRTSKHMQDSQSPP